MTKKATKAKATKATKAKKQAKPKTMLEVVWDSTMIESTIYNVDEEILEVKFLSGGTYRYFNVTNKDYLEFSAAESQGKHFIANIRGNHDYEKVNDN